MRGVQSIPMNTAKEIAKSLNAAQVAQAIRAERLARMLDAIADGTKFGKHEKITLGGHVFWVDGKRGLSSRQFLESLGTKLVKLGAISETDYYA